MRTDSGYTLLEMLMVLILFAMIAGIAVPRLTTVYKSVKWSMEKDDVLARISSLGQAARNSGHGFVLFQYPVEAEDSRSTPVAAGGNDDPRIRITGTTGKIPLDLPEGWRLKADPPILYTSGGVCLGGNLIIMHDRMRFEAVLRPPFGTIELPGESGSDDD